MHTVISPMLCKVHYFARENNVVHLNITSVLLERGGHVHSFFFLILNYLILILILKLKLKTLRDWHLAPTLGVVDLKAKGKLELQLDFQLTT